MGSSSSKGGGGRSLRSQSSSVGSSASSRSTYPPSRDYQNYPSYPSQEYQNYPPHEYQNYPPHEYQNYPSQRPHYAPQPPPPPQNASVSPPENHDRLTGPRPKLQRRYSRIADNYRSLEEVTEALAQAGLESSNLIVGIDFTKSNEWTGSRSFNRRSLHHIGDIQNPYEQAISIIGRTLTAFDEDNLIPCFGFGDASTHDQDVFSFYADDRPCMGFEEALTRYREIVPHLRLAGPTSFAPIIEMAISIVEQSNGQYHVLLIIADGQVTRSVDTESGRLSPQEKKTIDAIVKASEYPLSIILVGVGDGPWDMMREFDDNIPARAFDNFQFVNFTDIMSKNVPLSRKETEFALSALMEIPSQYKATIEHNILGRRKGRGGDWVALPPPVGGHSGTSYGTKPSYSSSYAKPSQSSSYTKPSQSSSYQPSSPPYSDYSSSMRSSPYHGQAPASTAPPASASFDNQICPICLTSPKDMAFGCGHQTCCECGESLDSCPICRSQIVTRIKLY